MFKKTLVGLCIISIILISGCSGKAPGIQSVSDDVVIKDAELMEGFEKSLPENRSGQDDSQLEIKHWQRGAPGPQINDSQTVSIQLYSIEEIEAVMDELVKLGYLKGPTRNKEEFKDALVKFQIDHDISATGTLDSSTIDTLSSNRDLSS